MEKLLFNLLDDTLCAPYMNFHMAMSAVSSAMTELGCPPELAAEIIQEYITALSEFCEKQAKELKTKTREEKRLEALKAAQELKESHPEQYEKFCKKMGVDDLIAVIEEGKENE